MVGYKDRPTEIGLRGVKKNLRVVWGESSGSPQILLRRWNAPVFFWDRYTTLGLKNSLLLYVMDYILFQLFYKKIVINEYNKNITVFLVILTE